MSKPISAHFRHYHRLLTPRDYRAVFDAPVRIPGLHMTLLAKANRLGYSRLGLIVSKKQLSTAVARNKVKRRLREYFRREKHSLSSVDMVIIAYKGLGTLNKADMQLAMRKQWAKLCMRLGGA